MPRKKPSKKPPSPPQLPPAAQNRRGRSNGPATLPPDSPARPARPVRPVRPIRRSPTYPASRSSASSASPTRRSPRDRPRRKAVGKLGRPRHQAQPNRRRQRINPAHHFPTCFRHLWHEPRGGADSRGRRRFGLRVKLFGGADLGESGS